MDNLGKNYILKNRYTNEILNSAYSPEGLFWTTDSAGRLICFKNARFEKVYDKKTLQLTNLKIVGDTRWNHVFIIENIAVRKKAMQSQGNVLALDIS